MLLLLSVFTISLSSFLLFLIQPLAAKELLPIFGGSPSVWNICMVFFQGVLLLGYFNTYITSRFFTELAQRALYFLIVITSLLMLPILWKEIHPQLVTQPEFNVLWLLISKLTLPLLVLSTTAPMVQYWFSRTMHPHAKDPYFLYSASNMGSLLALLGFPLLFEPFLGLQQLSIMWTTIYCVFVTVLVITAFKNTRDLCLSHAVAIDGTPEKLFFRRRLHWLLLSFASSCLLMAVTQYITTDIGATPFLWILPLVLYLLTFIIAFARHPLIKHEWMVREQVYFLIFPLLGLTQITLGLPGWQLILFHLVGFFALAMVCVGELVAARPSKPYLAEFYLWIALGGFLGGVFNSIIAPLIFNGIYEYCIAFCLCVLLRPWPQQRLSRIDFFMPLAIIIVLAINYFLYPFYTQIPLLKSLNVVVLFSVVTVIIIWQQNPWRFATCLAILFCYAQTLPGFNHHDLIWQSRNFFGLTRIYKDDALNLHMLMNGTTLHGVQLLNNSLDFNSMTTYYHPVKSVANLLIKEKTPLKIAIAGLGAGGLSCQFRKTDYVTFFEIDPTVVKIAQTPALFTYLKNCPPRGGIIIGDARLGIATAKDHYFDIIIIDVYSSDAIPIHLFTLNAIQLYLQKLTPDGLLMFNISSRHINIHPVLNTIAEQLHYHALRLQSNYQNNFQLPSEWIILTNNNKLAQQLQNELAWQRSDSNKKLLWTDDFSNVLRALKLS